MNDEKFDEDSPNSVLLEDAPRDLPEDLRRRVAAVPYRHRPSSPPSRTPWRLPVALGSGALVAIAVVLAAGLWRLGPASPGGVGGQRSASASVASKTSPDVAVRSPSPASSGSDVVGACRAADLVASILGWQGAAGSRIADVEVSNATTRPCFVRGTPELELVDARGRVLIGSATAGPSGRPHVTSGDPRFDLAPGGRLRTQVDASNYCGPAASPPVDIAFTLPSNGGRVVATPGAGVSSGEAVPPCLGSAGSHIAMRGWHR